MPYLSQCDTKHGLIQWAVRTFPFAAAVAWGLGASGAHAEKTTKVPNYSGSVTCEAGAVINARSALDVQAAVRKAVTEGKKLSVRSISASRSYSPVICPERGGTILNVEGMNEILNVDSQNMLVTVQPGVVLGHLQKELDRQGLAFPVTPDYNGVTVAGAMGAGAHHSSLRIPSAVGDWVQQVTLVDGRGEVQVLEGDALDAARVHLGLLGVVVKVTLKVVPQFKLQYQSTKLSDESLGSEGLERVRGYDYAKIHWFPHQNTYFVDGLSKVGLDTPGLSTTNTWELPPIAGILSKFPQPIAALNASRSFQCTVEKLRVNTWFPPYAVVGSPSGQPVGLSHDMLGGGCREGTCSWDRGLKTRTIEAAFAAEDFGSWVRDVKELVNQRAACFPVLGIYLRFSAPSRAYLGQAYGRETVMFEIHVPQADRQVLEASSDVYDEILQLTLGKYAGRPHWGKNSLPYFQGLGSEQFPRWENFKRVRKTMDPKGVFVNPFWKSIEAQVESISKPECGVTRECLCQTDADCGSNARCEAGIVFPQARICVKDR